MSTPDPNLLHPILRQVLRWSRERDYAGYSKHDALNSPLLSACALNLSLFRLVITQLVMRAPVNVRPLLGVPTGRNPKGVGLFAHAWLDVAETVEDAADRATCRAEAGALLDWLVAHASPCAPGSESVRAAFGAGPAAPLRSSAQALKGLGWGYHYPWQDQGFFQPRHFPNRVVTCWIGFAFLKAYAVTGRADYRNVCREIATFLLENPRILYEDAQQLCLSYVPLTEIDWAVMDVSALSAAFLAGYAAALPPSDPAVETLIRQARRLMAFVVDKQTDAGAWYYTWPADDSHIQHDNYHTAIILDCLADYMDAAADSTWMDAYRKGLDYYRRALFAADGAPRWMNDRVWPHDIHGAASGILAFTRAATLEPACAASHLDWADTILNWTLRNLYNRNGFFYYQQTWWGTKRFCLMRWCNAWMCRALAQRLRVGRMMDSTG